MRRRTLIFLARSDEVTKVISKYLQKRDSFLIFLPNHIGLNSFLQSCAKALKNAHTQNLTQSAKKVWCPCNAKFGLVRIFYFDICIGNQFYLYNDDGYIENIYFLQAKIIKYDINLKFTLLYNTMMTLPFRKMFFKQLSPVYNTIL